MGRMHFGSGNAVRRSWLGLLAAGVALVALPAAAQAVVLTPTATPLTGSNFQGGDGNQDETATLDDWQSLVGNAGLETLSDGTGASDDIYVGGKEAEPVNWNLGTGTANPGKSDILASWNFVDDDPDGPFLYLAFQRLVNQGNAFVAFELNQDKRLWRNANSDLIQCRTDGDLIISYEIQNSNNIEIIAQEWNSLTEVTNAEATTGGLTNGEGCSKTGNFTETDPGTDDAQAAINSGGSITNYLHPPAATTFGQGLFGEAALRVAEILDPGNPDACFSFGRFNMYSRSSRSDQSNLIDRTDSVEAVVRNCTISGTKWADLDGDGVRDEGDPGIEDYVLYIDSNHNDAFDEGEPTATTDQDGEYVFEDVETGTYEIREAPDSEQITANDGLACTFPTPVCENTATITAADQNDDGNDFGNAGQGSITVVKSLSPSTDAGLFDLQVDGTTHALNATNGGSTGAVAVAPGNHTVAELAAPGTDLADYQKSISCDDGTSVGVDNSSLVVNVSPAEDVVCTITNTREIGTLTVVKDLSPSTDSGLFNLQIDGVTEAPDAGNGGTTGPVTVGLGDHTVAETAGTGTDLADYQKSISCDDGTSVGVDNSSLVVNVSIGESVVCTITNVREELALEAPLPPPDKRFCSVEEPTIRGTNGPDKLIGTPGNDVIKGRGGNDVIKGKGGHDLICPNKGDDKAAGGSGRDTVRGGPDDDKLKGVGGNDFVHGYSGDDIVNGGKGTDGCRGGTGETVRISCEGRVAAL